MHILPTGPMCSLRRALLVWLVPLFLVVGAASSAVTCWSYSTMVGRFLDEQMQQMGEDMSVQEQRAVQSVSSERVHQWGAYISQVWNPQGQLESVSWSGPLPGSMGSRGFHDVDVGGTQWRVYTAAPTPTGHQVQVVQSSEFRRKLAIERAGAALLPVLILLPLAVVILWGVAARLSREVQDIGRRASQQDEHSIAELPLTRVPSEIVPLVESFNSLLTRLRDAFAVQRRFVQDAAHELRTPITAVALQLENVRQDLPPGVCADSFAQLEEGVHRAQRLVDQLLKMSRREATAGQEAPVKVDLQAQVRESINGLIALADRRRIDLGFVAGRGELSPASLLCNAADLRSVLDNLIENALRYTPEGGVVDVHLKSVAGHPVIEVVDNGPGIPPDQLGRVFDRFFRVPGNGTRGSGLGLSIAQSAAHRCGLRIVLKNRQDRSGLVARLELAAAAGTARSQSQPPGRLEVSQGF